MLKNGLKEIKMKQYMMNSKEFAEMLGVKLSTYSQWESGVNAPSLEKAFEIAKILNKQITEIWYGE
jgi:putative transcriptional regulator